MKADTYNLQKTFQSWCRLDVPLYQRPYVWRETTQWAPLWQDIQAAVGRREKAELAQLQGFDVTPVPHFVGAVVLEQVSGTLGNIETRLVIDGQQRLTTLQLLLEALCDHARQDSHPMGEALTLLTRNPANIVGHVDKVFKIWPTNVDQDTFRQVMLASSDTDLLAKMGKPSHTNDAGHQIANCYLYFFREMARWLGEDAAVRAQQISRMFTTLQQDIQLVVIELQGKDDPQLIFETLNARGTPLLPADLIKNHLFYKLKMPATERDELYASSWAEFDRRHHYWRAEVGRGHARRPRIDLFMQFYLSAATEAEVPVQHLYATFKNDSGIAKREIPEILADVKKQADLFSDFESRASSPPTDRVNQFFARLSAMDLQSAFPFLLRLLKVHDSTNEFIRATLIDIESFLVRRMVCQLSTRGYAKFFIGLISSVDADPSTTHHQVREYLLRTDAESGRWPSDQEFRKDWLEAPIYERQVRSRVRMLLEAIEHSLVSDMAEGHYVTRTLTIEHLMPQEWRANWPLPADAGVDAVARRSQMLHSLGNLTLVTAGLNSSVSNLEWSKKQPEFAKHTVFLMNQELATIQEWDEPAIFSRSERFLTRALAIWPRPN